MKDTIKVICEVEPTVKLCCINTECVNQVAGSNVCNLKNVIIGPRHSCAGYVKAVVKKPKKVSRQGAKNAKEKRKKT